VGVHSRDPLAHNDDAMIADRDCSIQVSYSRVVSGCPTVGRAATGGLALCADPSGINPPCRSCSRVILPVALICRRVVQQFLLFRIPNHRYIRNRPASPKGRFAIVTNARRDAVDADGASDEGA
jgi:hypothetical protein